MFDLNYFSVTIMKKKINQEWGKCTFSGGTAKALCSTLEKNR